jgi:hypothetical protein
MAGSPSITIPNVILNAQPVSSDTRVLEPTSLRRAMEEALRRAFGSDEKTIANSLRGL